MAALSASGTPGPTGGQQRAWRRSRTAGTAFAVHLERFFEEADQKRNVAVIDEWMARRYFPGESAIGHRFEGSKDGMIPPIEIVGVVGHVETYGLDGKGPVDLAWYVPQATVARIVPQYSNNVFVIARTAGDPLALAAPLRKVVEGIDPLQPVFAVQTLTQAVDESVARSRAIGRAPVGGGAGRASRAHRNCPGKRTRAVVLAASAGAPVPYLRVRPGDVLAAGGAPGSARHGLQLAACLASVPRGPGGCPARRVTAFGTDNP
jgi:hypothetical protein